ncbi:MAG: hypothetical protein WC408_01980, partial [Candidatus Micrarchaeia archaeon]
MADERVEKIRKVMQTDEDQDHPDVDKIIKRLKAAENEAKRPVIGSGSLKERLEGKQTTTIDLNKATITPTNQQTGQKDSLISFIGKFYA